MRKYLYLTVFISGLTSLGVEMAASRLLGNIFGTSNLVWASIIGLIMIYLAGGYFLGGYWADRSPNYQTFYRILIVAAISIGLVPLISQPVLKLAANAFDELELGVLFGSFSAVLILLSIPVILLGTASPFAIRLLLEKNENAGKISGRVYAISTLGSFVGTFLPVLLLIPTIGTYRTFILLGAILLIFSLIGLWQTKKSWVKLPLYLLPMLLLSFEYFGIHNFIKATPYQVFETESAYNYIQVLQQGDYTLLRLNEGQGIHSVYNPNQLNYYGSWEQVLVGSYFNPAPYDPGKVKSMAIVGLAAGTTARQASIVYKDIAIDGIEIDPVIIEVGRHYFDMNQPNLNVIIQDGRWGLAHSQSKYQVISVDAYRPPYIPWHLTTREFFQIVHDHLTDDGVLVVNVGRSPTDRSLIDSLSSTILTVFPSIHIVDIPNTFNSIIFATVQQTQDQNLLDNFNILQSRQDIHPLLLESMALAVTNLKTPQPNGQVFTDDIAPVEWVTNRMILEYVFSGDQEGIQ
jgi:spermidine synthase